MKLPARPTPPPCRIEYRGLDGCFFGPEDEFIRWKAQPWWRRFFGTMLGTNGPHANRPRN